MVNHDSEGGASGQGEERPPTDIRIKALAKDAADPGGPELILNATLSKSATK